MFPHAQFSSHGQEANVIKEMASSQCHASVTASSQTSALWHERSQVQWEPWWLRYLLWSFSHPLLRHKGNRETLKNLKWNVQKIISPKPRPTMLYKWSMGRTAGLVRSLSGNGSSSMTSTNWVIESFPSCGSLSWNAITRTFFLESTTRILFLEFIACILFLECNHIHIDSGM